MSQEVAPLRVSWALTLATLVASCTAQPSDAARTDDDVEDASADADASAASAEAGDPDVGDAASQAPAPPFTSRVIALESASCAPRRAGLAVTSRRRVLVTTGCGFYAVDPLADSFVQLKAQGDDLDSDGQTVAVLAGQLGLSRDGGETFAWTDWELGRCQGSPRVSAGLGLAVVSCVAGVGRFRGEGSVFEQLSPPDGALLIAAAVAAGGSRVVIHELERWFDSSNGGDSFAPLSVEGLPASGSTYGMRVIGSELWVPMQQQAGSDPYAKTMLYVAPLGSGTFTQRESFPGTTGDVSLSYNDGVLVVHGTRTFVSKDQGRSFAELQVPALSSLPAVAKYASGYLYRVGSGTLYVDALDP